MTYVSNAQRYQARTIDGLVLIAMFLLPLALFSALADKFSDSYPRAYFFWASMIFISLEIFFYIVCPLKLMGATFGMRLLGQKLVRVDQRPMTWLTVVLRECYSIVSGLAYGFGYWSALWHKKNQTWHDRWAGTVVIQGKK
jgi:uncharacterized RDD family membrane protein YckC